MINADEARSIILGSASEFRHENLPLREVHARILAVDMFSGDDIPPFKNSSMDGFAVRSSETIHATKRNPVTFQIQDEVAAGQKSENPLQLKSAVRVLTGAPIPDGSDAVIPLEFVSERSNAILVDQPISAGQNTRERGEDIKKGERVLAKGTYIKAAHLGVLASIGCSQVEVFAKPTVAILTTGDELLSVEENLAGGKIRNSNAYSLNALASEYSCEATDLGVARDNEADLREKIKKGLESDLLVTSGGISAGKYDYVLKVMKKAGVDIKFWKVNIKPGMPLAFGTYEKQSGVTMVFCLPGNPVSTVVTFLEYIRPCLQKMFSMIALTDRVVLHAKLETAITKRDGKRHYHRGVLRNEGGMLYVRSTGNQSSGVLTSLVKANCLIVLDEQQAEVQAGEEVEVELLPWNNVQ